MIIFLRQSNTDPSAGGSCSLTIQKCCFIKIDYAEVFNNRVEFFPKEGREHAQIRKTDDHDWIEPMSGIKYEFLFIKELSDSMPRHLEILYPKLQSSLSSQPTLKNQISENDNLRLR